MTPDENWSASVASSRCEVTISRRVSPAVRLRGTYRPPNARFGSDPELIGGSDHGLGTQAPIGENRQP